MPLIRRVPKRGFNNNRFKTVYGTVNCGDIDAFPDGAEIDEVVLRKLGLIKGRNDGVKILGDGGLTKRLTVTVNSVSASARLKIENAGGTVILK